jgi:poly(3-hydroxyalkanoate) synthetase
MSESEDLSRIYSSILEKSPATKIHSCQKIEQIEDQGVFELGKKVADECIEIIENLESKGKVKKISFLGFSFGGLVFRAAFEHLEKYKDKFHSYITFATPHFG